MEMEGLWLGDLYLRVRSKCHAVLLHFRERHVHASLRSEEAINQVLQPLGGGWATSSYHSFKSTLHAVRGANQARPLNREGRRYVSYRFRPQCGSQPASHTDGCVTTNRVQVTKNPLTSTQVRVPPAPPEKGSFGRVHPSLPRIVHVFPLIYAAPPILRPMISSKGPKTLARKKFKNSVSSLQ